ncbi:MAG: alpha-amylase family glycosyl hydrolase [Acidimicrobiales bacterium]
MPPRGTSYPRDEPWWRSAVVYQIYPRSFADGSGDGIGDLAGLRAKLEHLAWVGVDAVWLSPIFSSPMFDFGYDVSDYCAVDPVFGTLDEIDALIAEAHELHIRVLLDWVPNHTSHEHPWFVESRSSRDNPKRSWYVWRDPRADGGPPNNWTAAFTDATAWELDPRTEQAYLHLFLPEQPDLNWADPALEAAMHDVLRFWLGRGIDGFRMDVIHCIGKDPALPDDPPEWVGVPHTAINDVAETHPLLRRIRGVLDSYDGDRVSIGEVFLAYDNATVTERTVEYLGDGDELHLAFDFAPLRTSWKAASFRRRIEAIEAAYTGARWPTWVLSNHDNPRHRTRYGATEARARAAAVLLLTLRGTPFLYAGEELGLEDAAVPDDRVVDPGGRDGCRAPIPWSRAAPHGWDGEAPWLPFSPDPAGRSVETLRADPGSILHLYRRLIAVRRASPALSLGSMSLLAELDGVVAFERSSGADRRVVAVNFTGDERRVELPVSAGAIVEVASDGKGEGRQLTPDDARWFVVGPDQAVVLAPA